MRTAVPVQGCSRTSSPIPSTSAPRDVSVHLIPEFEPSPTGDLHLVLFLEDVLATLKPGSASWVRRDFGFAGGGSASGYRGGAPFPCRARGSSISLSRGIGEERQRETGDGASSCSRMPWAFTLPARKLASRPSRVGGSIAHLVVTLNSGLR